MLMKISALDRIKSSRTQQSIEGDNSQNGEGDNSDTEESDVESSEVCNWGTLCYFVFLSMNSTIWIVQFSDSPTRITE